MRFTFSFRRNNIFSCIFIMTKFSRTSTGKYSVAGKTYESLIGSRAQVWHRTAYKTTGGLTHAHLMKNKAGHIVSKSKHASAKREKRLVKAGFLTKKGHFGFIKNGKSKKQRGGVHTPVHHAAAHHAPVHMKKGGNAAHGLALPKGFVPAHPAVTMKKGGRKHHGGSGVNLPLSPSAFDGKGVGTSGVDLQFIAGNAN